ncbi:MAG: hypothetical protein WCH62_00520, partial [Candidatus Omnitrophota bacterium]
MKHLKLTQSLAQTAIEYLLILAVVGTLVLFSFSSLLPKIYTSSEGYYNQVTDVIIANKPNGKSLQPIDGRYCEVECPPVGSACGNPTRYRTCECPAPAFGGKDCGPTTPFYNYSKGTMSCTGDTCRCNGVSLCSGGCVPNCPSGRPCGALDGCGAPCLIGDCPSGGTCLNGSCFCIPSCEGKNCDEDDGCGILCGCPLGQLCRSGSCGWCTPGDGCSGKQCGADACGNASGCGSCPPSGGDTVDVICDSSGQCVPPTCPGITTTVNGCPITVGTGHGAIGSGAISVACGGGCTG